MAWWAPLVVAGVGAGINALTQRGAKKAEKDRAKRFELGQAQSLTDMKKQLAELSNRASTIRTDYTPTELYGPIMENITDRVQSDSDTATQDIFRGLMATGGDVSGSGTSALQGLRQTGQRSISDAIARFTELTDARNIRGEQRRDSLDTTVLSGQGQLSQLFSQLFSNEQGRVDRRSTAGRQFFLDIMGLGSQTAGQLYGMEDAIEPEPKSAGIPS